MKRFWISLSGLFLIPAGVWAKAVESVEQGEKLFTWKFLFAWLNFLLLSFFLWKWVGPRLREFLMERRQSIQEAVQGSEAQIQAARQGWEEARQRLHQLDQEIEELRTRRVQQAVSEREQLLLQTREVVRNMVAEAKELMEVERGQLVDQVRRELVETLIQLAEQKIGSDMGVEVEGRWFDKSVGRLKKAEIS